jgi:hypothetical protein
MGASLDVSLFGSDRAGRARFFEALAEGFEIADERVDVVAQAGKRLHVVGLERQLHGSRYRFVETGVEQLEAVAGVGRHLGQPLARVDLGL